MAPSSKNPMTQASSPRGKLLLGLLLLLAGLTYRELLVWGLDFNRRLDTVGWFFDLSETSPQFIYVLTVGLFYIRRKDIVKAFCRGCSHWSAMFFLVPGAGLFLWGRYVSATDIVYLSFLLVGFGSALFLAGKELARTILFPVLILALAIPLPAVLINQIVFPFQLWTAEHSAWLLNLIGIPALPKGDMISMAETSVRVAESCTALGFLKWLTTFALAYAYIFPVTRLHAVLLILAAPVIAYGVNLLRAFTLVLNPELEVLSIHTVQGIAFFLIGFFLIYAVDNLLLRIIGNSEQTPDHAHQNGNRPGENTVQRQQRLLMLIPVFSAMLVASVWLPRWALPSTDPAPEIGLAEVIDDWEMTISLPLNHRFLGSIRYSSYVYRVYARDNETVSIFIGSDDRLHRNRSFLSPKNTYQDVIGLVEEHSLVDLEPGDQHAVALLTEVGLNRVLTYHWYEETASVAEEVLRALLALDKSPFRRAEPARVIRVATFVAPTPQGRMLADKRLRDFLGSMREAESKRAEPD